MFFGKMKLKKKKDVEKKPYVLLVNSSYDFLCFEDKAHRFALYENIYTGQIIRLKVADGTFCPV